MKKFLAIALLTFFLGGLSAPLLAKDNSSIFSIVLADKDPTKKDKADKKASDGTTEKKASDCNSKKKASDCATEKKASDCKSEKKASDCSK